MTSPTLELAKSLYVSWLRSAALSTDSREERKEIYQMVAEYAFEAAETFVEMDRLHNA